MSLGPIKLNPENPHVWRQLLLPITNKLITKIRDNFSLNDVHFCSCRKAYFSLIYCCPLNAKIIVATHGDGYRLTYPSKGNFTICHPINKTASQEIETAVFNKLKNVMNKVNQNVQILQSPPC